MNRTSTLMLLGVIALSFLALSKQSNTIKTSELRLTQIAGHELFHAKKCAECHTLGEKAEGKLTPIPNMREDAWFSEHVATESPIVLSDAKSKRKQRRVLKNEIAALVDFLYESGKSQQKIISLPEKILQGAYLSYQNNCTGCHQVAGSGKDIGPDLTFIADRKGDKAWHIANLKNPQQFSTESPMPAFEGKVSEENLGKIADYLLTLRK